MQNQKTSKIIIEILKKNQDKNVQLSIIILKKNTKDELSINKS